LQQIGRRSRRFDPRQLKQLDREWWQNPEFKMPAVAGREDGPKIRLRLRTGSSALLKPASARLTPGEPYPGRPDRSSRSNGAGEVCLCEEQFGPDFNKDM
jgi:hypothetical protein